MKKMIDKDETNFPKELYRFDERQQGYVLRTITYICPDCKRTVNQPVISTYQVNTICNCQYPHYVNQMVMLEL